MGADRGVLVSNEGLETGLSSNRCSKGSGRSRTSQSRLRGKQAIDDDNMHVGTMVAEMMSCRMSMSQQN